MAKHKIAALGALVAGTIGAVALTLPQAAGAATPPAQVPPACVRVPVPNPFIPGAQIQSVLPVVAGRPPCRCPHQSATAMIPTRRRELAGAR